MNRITNNSLGGLLLGASLLLGGALAHGQTSIRLFFDETGLSNPADPASPIAGSPAMINPEASTIGGPARLYLWASFSHPDHSWIVLSLELHTEGSARIESSHMLNPTFPGGFQRWLRTRQGTIDGDRRSLTNVLLFAAPIGDEGEPLGIVGGDRAAGDLHHDATTNSTLLGWVDVSGHGEVFIAVGATGIARLHAGDMSGERVFLGFGDELAGLRGATYSTRSPIADARAVGCAADFNGDGQVDFFDYLDFVLAYDAEDPAADFNGDGQIDFYDYLDFVLAFDEGC